MPHSLQLNWKLPAENTNNRKKGAKKSSQLNENFPFYDMGRVKKSADKYGLRACSLKKRSEVEARKGLPKKRGPKPKPKSQPMSKYRRKTANLRERMRMGEINTAFEKLRQKIPQSEDSTSHAGKCEKLTKINILHVAINYIKALESILITGEAGIQVFGTSIICSPTEGSNGALGNLSVEVKRKSPQVKKIKISGCQENPEKKPNGKGKDPQQLIINDFPVLSDDSGIAEDFDDENTLEDWPDWTELTSTLDFPTQTISTSSAMNMKLLTKPHLDVLLSNIIAFQGNEMVRKLFLMNLYLVDN